MNDSGVTFKQIGSKSVVDQIVDQLTESIINGQLKRGSKIPTELELCEQFGVGRNSIREAIKILVALGVLEIRRAEGTFVVDHFSDKMLNPLIYGIILEDDPKSLFQLKKIIESGGIQLAIQNADERDCELIERRRAELEAQWRGDPPDLRGIIDADIAFHNAVNVASHNSLLEKFGSVLFRVSSLSQFSSTKKSLEDNQAEFLIQIHNDIAQAIFNKEVDKVEEIVQRNHRY